MIDNTETKPPLSAGLPRADEPMDMDTDSVASEALEGEEADRKSVSAAHATSNTEVKSDELMETTAAASLVENPSAVTEPSPRRTLSPALEVHIPSLSPAMAALHSIAPSPPVVAPVSPNFDRSMVAAAERLLGPAVPQMLVLPPMSQQPPPPPLIYHPR